MIRIAHLLDDFGMGGVTRALTLFERPELRRIADSKVVAISTDARVAPAITADVIVDHRAASWRSLPFLVSLRLRNPGAHIVRVEHSYTRAFEQSRVRSKSRFRTMLRTAALLVDEVICVSHAQREWLVNSVGVHSDKLRTIYPWSGRMELLDVEPKTMCENGPVRLLSYGRYADVKNFAELIIALRSFKPSEVQLTLFGSGPERTVLDALAAEIPHVQVFGPKESPGVWLSACDAVILPSRYEAFGLVATEARMAGRPIIVADVDGLPEQAAEGGLVANLSSAYDIAQAIRRATKAPLVELGAAARQGVLGQHDKVLRDWCDLIIGKSRGCRNNAQIAIHQPGEAIA